MRLREYLNRFSGGTPIKGAVMQLEGMEYPMMLYYAKFGEDEGGMAFFSEIPESSEHQDSSTVKLHPVEVPSFEEFLDTEVVRWVGKNPLMEGDTVVTEAGDNIVEHVKEGNGSPYPIVARNKKTGEQSQFKWDEVKMVKKNNL